jgi:exoribonuclease II
LRRYPAGLTRRDLTVLDFVTIDSASTEDMDDALYVESGAAEGDELGQLRVKSAVAF